MAPNSNSDIQTDFQHAIANLQAAAERNRETGAQTLNNLLQVSTYAASDILPILMPVLEARTREEPSEEVLLLVYQVLETVLTKTKEVLPEYSRGIYDMIHRACNDPYHLNTLQGCRCVSALARFHDSPHLRALSESLVVLLAPLLAHRQQKVRLAAVAALADAVPRGGQAMIPQLMACRDPHSVPYADFYEPSVSVNFFARLASDTAIPVRRAFLTMVAAWLGDDSAGDSAALMDYRKEMAAYQDTLFPYLLTALADEAPAVSSEAVNTLERLGTMCNADDTHSCLAEEEESCRQIDRGILFWGIATADGFAPAESRESCQTLMPLHLLRAPFASRPSAGARKLVQAHITEMLSGLSGDMLGWSAGPRGRAAKLLRVCMLCWEAAIEDHLQKIAPLLIKGMEDEKAGNSVKACCFLVGFHVPESAWTVVMQPWMDQVGATLSACHAVWEIMHHGFATATKQEALQGLK